MLVRDPTGSRPWDRAGAPSTPTGHPSAHSWLLLMSHARELRDSRRVLGNTQPIQIQQHARSRSPDVASLVLDIPHLDLAGTAELAALRALIARFKHVAQRHLECVAHFLRVQRQLEARPHERDYRCHSK